MTEFELHLKERHVTEKTKAWVDYKRELVIFSLYTIEGVWGGLLRYDWKGSKEKKAEHARYTTIVTKGHEVVYGLETLDFSQDTCFVVEGIFDALRVHALGYNAIAVLTSTPKVDTVLHELNKQFNLVSICDGDAAGVKLAKHTPSAIFLPEGEDPASFDNLGLILCGY